MKVRAGKDVWALIDPNNYPVAVAVQPNDPGPDFIPWYNRRRVKITSGSYKPYKGTSDWVQEANRSMRRRLGRRNVFNPIEER